MTVLDVTLPAGDDDAGWRNREWIVTNGLGGYASGTLAGVCTRRYHGVFVPNLARPRGRHVLVSRLDEEISFGGQTYRLGGSDRVGQPLSRGNAPYLRAFRLDGNIACWTFDCGELTLERRLVMPHQRNTTCLRYEITRGPPALIRLRPFLPFRRQDAPLRRPVGTPFEVTVGDDGACRVCLAYSELQLVMRLPPERAAFVAAPMEEPDSWLWREELRGYECYEAIASPGCFEWQAEPHVPRVLVLTTEEIHPEVDAESPFEEERQRAHALVQRAGVAGDPFLARLVVAADQFLILPENRGEESTDALRQGHALRTVVAGYHWFLDWGRDTMIALEGLMLATGRHSEARATLLTFSHYVRDGLLPNLFPEGSREGWYHTVDATLWYFHAIHRYCLATGDTSLRDELMPVLRGILRHHFDGTRFGIGVDPSDGLLRAAAPRHALTWMDAHMGEWIVTPRRGKPVEIQALWYNALCLMAQWETAAADREDCLRRAELARLSFNARFWNPGRDCLYDVVDGEQGDDPRLRPNQLFAISLDHPVLEPARWPLVLDAVRAELLTPMGLRTLDPRDPAYSRTYHGNLKMRDAAYHQGTVWPWLLGAFIDTWLKVHKDAVAARALLAAFPGHLQVAGLGTISEVFDGDPPYVPHGCIAQAWSVAEVLRCWRKLWAAMPVESRAPAMRRVTERA
jgi:predicted glycogen debranching enzyme